MPDRVAIVGVGHTQFRATSPGVSCMQILTGAFDVVAVQT